MSDGTAGDTAAAGPGRRLALLWRGPLDSCNYACSYCPFAKRRPLPAVMEADRAALARFVAWVEAAGGARARGDGAIGGAPASPAPGGSLLGDRRLRPEATPPCGTPTPGGAAHWSLELLFTPYGEALIWPWYRDALVSLSRLPHVRRVVIQTNGSAPIAFVDAADLSRLALWISWHPTEIPIDTFVARIAALHERGVRLSVGAVAVPAHLEAVESLRAALPAAVPLWINAQKPGVRYDADTRARWTRLDPTFPLDLRPHATRGRACVTGDEVLSVDGAGALRRCHFVDTVLGNLYSDALETLLAPRPCPRARCDCFIGYAHVPDLGLRDVYGDDLYARMRMDRG